MSKKSVIAQFQPFKAADANTVLTSQTINVLQNSDNLSFHCLFDGNVTGTFTVEAANYLPTNPIDPIDWYELGFASPLTLTSESECQILLNSLPFQAIRLVWTPSSAAGRLLTANVVSKTVGA